MIIRRLTNIILPLLLAVFLIAGCSYAYTRDLSNGCNKIYVTPGDAVGQVEVTETVQQWFVPGHDYDGVSLLIDHNKAANAGTVTVAIYRGVDDTCVLQRTLPVVAVARGRYTYFASGETIEAEAGEAFYLVATYSGPAAGVVVARTGDMPEIVIGLCMVDDVPSPETVAFGIVTDYQYDPANTGLMIAAFIIMTISLAAILIGWNHIQRNTGWGRGAFLAAYYGVITGLFLIALSMTAQRTYEGISSGWMDIGETTADDRWSLKDDGSLDAYVTIPADNVCGMQIPVYLPQYIYTSESLTIKLQEPLTGHVYQTATYMLADIDENGIYLALDDRYAAGTRLALHMVTSGMSYEDCPGFYMVDAGDTNNTVYYGGARQEGHQLYLTMYQSTVTHSCTRQVLFYAAAVLIGLILAWLLFGRNVPILRGVAPSPHAKTDHPATTTPHPARQSHRRAILLYVFTVLIGAVVMDYTYAVGIRPTQDCIYPEMVSYSADGNHDWAELSAAEERVQTFTVTSDSLSGVGLMLSEDKGESVDDIADCVIHLAIKDAGGNVLDEVQYAIGELEYLRTLLANDYSAELPEGFCYIPFSEDLHVAVGTELTLGISALEENTGSVLIAENPLDQAHLITAYHSYHMLARIYWPVMIVMYIAVVALLIAARQYAYHGLGMISPLTACMALAAITAVILTFLIPPFNGPDDMAHIKTIYWMFNQWTGNYDAAGAGRLQIMAADVRTLHKTGVNITIDRYNDLLTALFVREPNDGMYSTTAFANAIGAASIWTYLPALLGFTVFRVLGFSCITGIMGARWFSLVIALLLIGYGIRKSPFAQNSLMIILLFPMLLQQTASCSYDAMINAFTMLFIGYALHLLYSTECTVVDYMVTLLAAMLLSVNKYGVYLPILGILLIPILRRLLWVNRRYLLAVAAIGTIGIGVVSIRYLGALPQAMSSVNYTLMDMIRTPMVLVHLLENTLVQKGDRLFLNMIGTEFGALEVDVPGFLIIAICILLIIAWRSEQKATRWISKRVAWYLWAIQLVGIVIICIAFALAWTPRTVETVSGLQGRYFLPYFMVLNIAVFGYVPKGRTVSQYWILYGMGLIHMLTIALIMVNIFG